MGTRRMIRRYERSGLEVLQERDFLRLCEVSYIPRPDGSVLSATQGVASASDRRWEMVQRVSRRDLSDTSSKTPAPFAVDAVEVCAFLRCSTGTFLILVAQYRPPVDAVVLEFPAGLVDQGESLKAAALRELKEETGYVATEEDIISVTNVLCYEPGLTDSCCQLVRLFVDGEKEINRNPEQQLDEGEDIEVVLLPMCFGKSEGDGETSLDLLSKILEEKNKTQRTIVDARLYMYLDGLSTARREH